MQELRDGDARQVGPFALAGRLGSGGMGAVYLGRSAGGRTVAVKVVRPDLAEDPAFRERFRHEVTAARRVSGAFTAPVVMFRIVHTPPDLGAVPAGLRPLLQACLEQDPAARPTPRQVVEYVEQADRPAPSGGWLPDPVAADVVAVRAVLTALPASSPTRILPQAPDHRPRSGPSRRTLILGLTGGALAAAGAVGAALTLGDGKAGDTGGQGKAGSGAAKGAVAVDRPAADSAPEALLAWKVSLPATCPTYSRSAAWWCASALSRSWGSTTRARRSGR